MKQPKDNRIAEQRRKKGITQQQLADALSVHWMTISKLERGKMQLTLGWIERIAGALKVSIFDLVTPEATAQEVAVAGQILNGLTVEPNTQGSNYESVVRVVDDLISDWYRISGRDFEPFFFDGDLVKITQHWKGFFETCVGRLGYV
jgi:transcriptional regulator with XRE-family HTH domain